MSHMPGWKLVAHSPDAKAFKGPQGFCDLGLDEQVGTRLGRSANGPGSITLDKSWSLVSKSHCRLAFQEGCWRVVDESSTNGTFINSSRLAKGVPTPIWPGNILRLAALPASGGNQHVIEYKLKRLDKSPAGVTAAAQQQPAAQQYPAEQPAAHQFPAEQPASQQPPAKQPPAKQPLAQQPLADTPALAATLCHKRKLASTAPPGKGSNNHAGAAVGAGRPSNVQNLLDLLLQQPPAKKRAGEVPRTPELPRALAGDKPGAAAGAVAAEERPAERQGGTPEQVQQAIEVPAAAAGRQAGMPKQAPAGAAVQAVQAEQWQQGVAGEARPSSGDDMGLALMLLQHANKELRAFAKQDREAKEAAEAEAKQAGLAARLAQERRAAELAEAKRAAAQELEEVKQAAAIKVASTTAGKL